MDSDQDGGGEVEMRGTYLVGVVNGAVLSFCLFLSVFFLHGVLGKRTFLFLDIYFIVLEKH